MVRSGVTLNSKALLDVVHILTVNELSEDTALYGYGVV